MSIQRGVVVTAIFLFSTGIGFGFGYMFFPEYVPSGSESSSSSEPDSSAENAETNSTSSSDTSAPSTASKPADANGGNQKETNGQEMECSAGPYVKAIRHVHSDQGIHLQLTGRNNMLYMMKGEYHMVRDASDTESNEEDGTNRYMAFLGKEDDRAMFRLRKITDRGKTSCKASLSIPKYKAKSVTVAREVPKKTDDDQQQTDGPPVDDWEYETDGPPEDNTYHEGPPQDERSNQGEGPPIDEETDRDRSGPPTGSDGPEGDGPPGTGPEK